MNWDAPWTSFKNSVETVNEWAYFPTVKLVAVKALVDVGLVAPSAT